MLKTDYCAGYVELLTQELDGVPNTPRNPLILTDTPQPVTLMLTAQEFTELFSAVLAGADAIYPEKAHQVVWYLWRAVEY